MDITELQKETRDSWVNYKGRGVITHEEEWLDELITHVYTTAINECRHELPEFKDMHEPSVGLDTGWKAEGWNACTSEADRKLKALLPTNT